MNIFIAVNKFLTSLKILHFTFLFQTFKKNIESRDQYNGPILAPLQVKSIFGKIPPIYDVHCQIRNELEEIVNNWKEDVIVGNVILKHVSSSQLLLIICHVHLPLHFIKFLADFILYNSNICIDYICIFIYSKVFLFSFPY